jgi:hypothetical protein
MVQIKFIALGANSAIGAFQPGDKLRCSEEMARHLVEESGVAERIQPASDAAASPVSAPAAEAERKAPAKRRPRRDDVGMQTQPATGADGQTSDGTVTELDTGADAPPAADAAAQAGGDAAAQLHA